MNTRTVVSAAGVGALSFFTSPVPISMEWRVASIEPVATSTFSSEEDISRECRDRFGRPMQLLESQYDIVKRVAHPFRIQKLTLHWIRSDRVRFESVHESSGIFPCARIVNLPTGVGKTVMTTLGAIEASRRFRTRFVHDFARFRESYRFVTLRGSVSSMLDAHVRDVVLLPNVVLVIAPKHLVGQWRDTFRANATAPSIHVFPSSASLTHTVPLDVDKIRANPEHTFVYIVHAGNYKRFLEVGTTTVVAGVAIVDEADSERYGLGKRHPDVPVAMYALFVTATPQNILRGCQANHMDANNIVASYFVHPALPRIDVVSVGFDEYSLLGRQVVADIVAMQIVIPYDSFQSRVVDEISSRIPDMHSYTIRTRVTLARHLRASANDLENARPHLTRIEQQLEVRIFGQTIDAMQTQIRQHIAHLRGLARRTTQETQRLARLESTLARVQDMEGFCGICLTDFTPESSASLRISSCCGFFICPSCHERIDTCAKCRNVNVRYFDLVQSAGAGAGAGAAPPVAPIAAAVASTATIASTKDVDGFERWMQTFLFAHMDQREALHEIVRRAMEFGLTHLILAGANVDTWKGLEPNVHSLYQYAIVRPAGHAATAVKKTAKRLDAAYRQFCAGEHPSILILDSERHDAVELTGIDAGVTDLIVQVGSEAGGYAYQQLAGRAMRFGRLPTNPVRVIMA